MHFLPVVERAVRKHQVDQAERGLNLEGAKKATTIATKLWSSVRLRTGSLAKTMLGRAQKAKRGRVTKHLRQAHRFFRKIRRLHQD